MILADENIDARIISFLGTNNVEVLSIAEKNPGVSDEEAISLSKSNQLSILTEDKDFGEWVFAHGIKDSSILFLTWITH